MPIQIHGNTYTTVAERIKEFRESRPDDTILTEIISHEAGVCIVKATIMSGDKVIATGHAQEKEGGSYINKESYVENCETSAVGRALGMLGIGISDTVCSADEVQTRTVEYISEHQKQQIFEAVDNAGITDKELHDYLLKKDIDIHHIPVELYPVIIKWANSWKQSK